MSHQFRLAHKYPAVAQLRADTFDSGIAHVLDLEDPEVCEGVDGGLDVGMQPHDELFAVLGGFGGGDHAGALGFGHLEQNHRQLCSGSPTKAKIVL